MSETKQTQHLRKRLKELQKSLGQIGCIAQGSILRRTIERADPRNPKKTKTYGPYFQWTRKIAGRTVTHNLTEIQSPLFATAIKENRKLEKTISQMRVTSLKLLELNTEGVQRRTRRSGRGKSET